MNDSSQKAKQGDVKMQDSVKEPKQQHDKENCCEKEAQETDSSSVDELYSLYQAIIKKEKEQLMKHYEAERKRNARFIENPDDSKAQESLYPAPPEDWAKRTYDVIFDKELATIVIEAERKRKNEEEAEKKRRKAEEAEKKKRKEEEEKGAIKGSDDEMKAPLNEDISQKAGEPQSNEVEDYELGLTELDKKLSVEAVSQRPKARGRFSRLLGGVRRVTKRWSKLLLCCRKQTVE